MINSTVRTLAAAGLAVAAVTAVQTPAYAAYTPQSVCGSSFSTLKSYDVKTAGGVVYGKVYLTYSSATGENCVTTIKSRWLGSKTQVSAHLVVQNVSGKTDAGYFEYYAGPVKLKAADKCVVFDGGMLSADGTTHAWGGTVDWGFCG